VIQRSHFVAALALREPPCSRFWLRWFVSSAASIASS
jgi:hypothetical protein